MKRKAAEGYALIPEGEQVLCIDKVDTSDYAKFDKLVVTLKNSSGAAMRVNFNFVKDDGEPNMVADGIYTRLARAALNDQTLDEIDSDDLAGNYVRAEIEHRTSDKGTFANIKKILGHADGFTKAAEASIGAPPASRKKTAAEIIAEAKARRAATGK